MNFRIKKLLEPLIMLALPILLLLLMNYFLGEDIKQKAIGLFTLLYLSGVLIYMTFKASRN